MHIYQKVNYEIHQFCLSRSVHDVYVEQLHTVDDALMTALQRGAHEWVPALDIIAVRTNRPSLPEHIQRAYHDTENAKHAGNCL